MSNYVNTLQNVYQSIVQPYMSLVISTAVSYIPNSDQSRQISALFCAVNAAEMGIRAVGNLVSLASESPVNQSTFSNDLSKNLAGALLYGGCALNPIPGSAKVGAIVALSMGVFFGNNDSTYVTWKAVNKTVTVIHDYFITPVIIPIVETIWKIVKPIFNFFYNTAKEIIALIGRINLPFNATWAAVGFLTLATVVYNKYLNSPWQ